MRFFTASYFEPQNHHGEIVSISRRNPPQFQNVMRCVSLAPSQSLLNAWRSGISEREYIDRYREEVRLNWHAIILWLRAKAGQEDDLTLCCWEKSPGQKGRTDDRENLELKLPGVLHSRNSTTEKSSLDRKYFCHRNLVAKIIQRHFPENYGGCDVPNSCTFSNLR